MAMPRVDGTERLALPRADVWRLLNDPEILGASIPGCRGFERDGDAEHRYRTAIKVAVGAVTGVYEGFVEYTEVHEPERCTIVVEGKGDKGTISGQGEISLAEAEGATEVGYRGDFKITGPVAGVGQRMAPGISRKMIVETLRNLERHGNAGTPASEPAAEAAPAQAASPAPAAAPETAQPTPAAPAARAPAASPDPGGDDAFRPLAVSPRVAFAAGCVVGGVIVAIVALLL
jgi:carbon monoxide dehydrogenase subunit G